MQPEVTAMVLGSVYARGAYFFARVHVRRAVAARGGGLPGGDRVRVDGRRSRRCCTSTASSRTALPFARVGGAVRRHAVRWCRGWYARNHRRYGAPSGPPLPRGVRLRSASSAACSSRSALRVPDRPRRGDRQLAVDADAAHRARSSAPCSRCTARVWLAVAVHGTWRGARIPLEAHAIGLAFLLLAVVRGRGRRRLGQSARDRDRGGRRGDARRSALLLSRAGP